MSQKPVKEAGKATPGEVLQQECIQFSVVDMSGWTGISSSSGEDDEDEILQ